MLCINSVQKKFTSMVDLVISSENFLKTLNSAICGGSVIPSKKNKAAAGKRTQVQKKKKVSKKPCKQ